MTTATGLSYSTAPNQVIHADNGIVYDYRDLGTGTVHWSYSSMPPNSLLTSKDSSTNDPTYGNSPRSRSALVSCTRDRTPSLM